MDWKNLFLNANGRIGQKDFWIGFLILFVVSFVVHFIPVLGQILWLVLIYPTVCLYSKRLHDFGKSGWLVLVPYAVLFLALVIAVMFVGTAVLMGGASNLDTGAAAAGAVGGLMLAGLVGLAALLVCLGFLLWVGLSKGDPGPNRYGSPPLTAATATAVF